ncbi:hypothetical protein PYCCODRAFT_85007 [Trametes coccinea BRFM310]|uniref:Uncharacterized protein n=1 Tax=Trametes coccinea (strain BRFM310) TaxID=1353009 RepID=A0A1Y2IW85_TRAC3|nr:hypothetical protein PYCCODRAFT_85007 [Trametes coccinea BRFM310]
MNVQKEEAEAKEVTESRISSRRTRRLTAIFRRKRRRLRKRYVAHSSSCRVFQAAHARITLQKAEKKEARVKAKRSALREASKAPATLSPIESGTSTAAESTSDSAPETSTNSLSPSAPTSASESENASGADADTEESVTSEEESDKVATPAELMVPIVDAATGKEKWVAVRAQPLSDTASAVVA